MKYLPILYAQAYMKARKGVSEQKEPDLLRRLVTIMLANRDGARIARVLDEIIFLMVFQQGDSFWEIELARTPSSFDFGDFFNNQRKNDYVRIRKNSALIAGARITRNRQEELDISLSDQLHKLFV